MALGQLGRTVLRAYGVLMVRLPTTLAMNAAWQRIPQPWMKRRGLPDSLLHDSAQSVTWRWSSKDIQRYVSSSVAIRRSRMRPPALLRIEGNLLGIFDTIMGMKTMAIKPSRH